MGCLWIVLALVALLAVGWIVSVTEMWRDAALKRLAARLRLDFCFGLPPELRDILPRFRPIRDARERGGEFHAGINSITGLRRGRRVAFFDYEYATVIYAPRRPREPLGESREYRHTRRASAVAAELGFSSSPLLVRPERWTDKVAAVLGYEDVDFAALPEFSRRFYVNGPDRVFARRLVTPLLARFFVDRVRCAADFCGSWVLLYTGRRLSARQAERLIDLASQLADLATHEFAGDKPSGGAEESPGGSSR